MPVYRSEMHRGTLRRLNQAINSPIGNVPSGVDLTSAISTETSIDTFLNEGMAWFCRACYPIPGRAVLTDFAVGRGLIQLSATPARMDTAAVDDGSYLHVVTGAAYNDKPLSPTEWEVLDAAYGQYQLLPHGTPELWFRHGGEDYVGLYPVPAASQNAMLFGFVIPPKIHEGEEVINWIAPDRTRLLEIYAALQLALKNFADRLIAERIGSLIAELEGESIQIWNGLSPTLKQKIYPTPPKFLRGAMLTPDSGPGG